MPPPSRSRWANSEEDVAAEKRRKEERQRRKAAAAAAAAAEQRRRRQEGEEKERAAKATRNAGGLEHGDTSGDNDGNDTIDSSRPAKKRRLSPETPARGGSPPLAAASPPTSTGQLYRFPLRQWGRAGSTDAYDKLNDIEEGTYGWVVRAKEVSTGEVVALKKLKLDAWDRHGLPVTGLREIQILKQCRHRNIVELRDVVVGNLQNAKLSTSISLVLEFVEHDLKTILEDMSEPFLPSEIKRLLLQLASGVEYLHDNWILHRDLKTSNILLNNRGRLKIADFGMARYVGDPSPPLTQLVVTLWYRAPELLLGARTYDQAIDMWSVGCIFAELLAREPLLQGKNELDQIAKTFDLVGFPTEETWPGFRKLPNARTMRPPPPASAPTPPPFRQNSPSSAAAAAMRSKFPSLSRTGCDLLGDLLALDPQRRPRAGEMLEHEYFKQDPKPKQETMFPTFPSKAGQERRRREEPHAPARGQAAVPGQFDWSTIFQGR